ncbi:MAG: type II toxin-antitoxin system VapC family toxin [Woeseia sp.]
MSFLIDTNVISEIRKQDRMDPHVAAWFSTIADEDLYLSVLVIGEIRQGIERTRPRDPQKAVALDRWLTQVRQSFGRRILPITVSIAEEWGRLNRVRPLPAIDSLLAATAHVNGLTLVTRNVADIADTGVTCLDPFHP